MGLFNIFKSKRYDMDTLDGYKCDTCPAKDYIPEKTPKIVFIIYYSEKLLNIKKQDEWIVLLHACENQTHYLIMSNGHY